jgi:Flp pilus assembly protein TadD
MHLVTRRPIMRKTFLIIVSILLAGGLLSAQDWKGKGRVSGLITDPDGKPLEGVKVKLVWTKSDNGFETVTDKDGKWTAAWINKGTWNVDLDKSGYIPVKKSMEISEVNRNPELKIVMQKAEGPVLRADVEETLGKANQIFDQKDYSGALKAYNEILAKFPDLYVLWKNVGNCYFAQEQYDKAEEAYRKVLEKNANDSDALQAVGNCYFNRNQTEQALEWYGKIQFEKIADPAVLYNIGLNLFKSSKFEEALKYFKRSTEVQKDFEDGYYHLGLANTSLGKKEEAVATFELFLKLFPKSDKGAQVQGFLDYLKKK